MQEQLISYETAKIAKEKGFDEKCSFSYKEGSPVELYQHEVKKYNNSWKQEWVYTTRRNSDMINSKVNRYSAPTQSLLQSWLREKHFLHIILIPTVTGNMTYKIIDIQCNPEHEIERPPYKNVDAYDYNDYESALEAGLQEALKLI